jgi:3-oxoacyl-[acyl-carrier protein] reductase
VTVIVFDPTEALSTALGEEAEAMLTIDGADEEPMWEALLALQTAYRSSAGRIVLILPTIGIAGAAAAVDYTTAIEGIRAMAKSAARQWASERIGVNIVAAPADLFTRDVDTSHLSAAAVPDDGALIHSVVETARFLLRDDLPHVTGETVIVDGGSVMLP